jgi:phytoene dehydrogenase-like protein
MADKSVVIIGAGLAGLAAGCYGQINGYKTKVFEHHTVPGGVVTSWKRKGYTINYAPHFMWGAGPGESIHRLYLDVGILPKNNMIDRFNYGFIDGQTGRRLVLSRQLEELAATLIKISPSDAKTVTDLIAGARAVLETGIWDMGLDKPPELSGVMDSAKIMLRIRKVFKYFWGKYAQPVSAFVRDLRDPFLRRLLVNLFLPEVPVWFLCMVLAMCAAGRALLLEDSSLEMARTMESRYKSLGGEIRYSATVEEILIEGGRATGVRLTDGGIHRSDAVISAADGHSTLYKMLGGRYLDDRTERRYRDWPLIRPSVSTTLGAAMEFPDEPYINIITLEKPFAAAGKTIDTVYARLFNYSPRFAPPGKTVVQIDFETEWDYWDQLHRSDAESYRHEKDRIAKELLVRLERYYTGLTAAVEMTDVATPYTVWRYTRNYRGAFMGWLPTPKTINSRVARTLPGLGQFYMAGQWVMPGGGVVPSLYSGRHAIQLICRADGRTFTT